MVCTADGAGVPGGLWRRGPGLEWLGRGAGGRRFLERVCASGRRRRFGAGVLPGSAVFRAARSRVGACKEVLAAFGVVCTADGAGVPGGLWRRGPGLEWLGAWRWGTTFFGTCLCFRTQAALWCRELLPGSAGFRGARSCFGGCRKVLAAWRGGVVCTADGAGVPGGLRAVWSGARGRLGPQCFCQGAARDGFSDAYPGRKVCPGGFFGRRTRGFCRRGNRKGAGTQKVCTFLQRKSGFLLNFFAKSDTIILYSFKARDFTESSAFRI